MSSTTYSSFTHFQTVAVQIPSSPFCNKITGFTHHGLQFFFLILKHFSFQKKKGFVGHLGPLPGFFQTQVWPQSFMSTSGGVVQTFTFIPERLQVETSDWSPPHLWGYSPLEFGTSCLGMSCLSDVAPVAHQSPWQQGWRGFLSRVGGENSAKSDGWNQHLHLLFQQCHFQVRSTLGG